MICEATKAEDCFWGGFLSALIVDFEEQLQLRDVELRFLLFQFFGREFQERFGLMVLQIRVSSHYQLMK
jgi:hypothetical protein